MKVETVLIENGEGFLRINKSSYDPTLHTLYQGEPPNPKAPDLGLISVNTANLTKLKQLPNVNVAVAKRIIDGRPYSSLEDLKQVQGLTISAIANLVSFE